MANLLNSSMVMDMGNVFFLLFNIYIYFPCNDIVYIFEWANTKQQQQLLNVYHNKTATSHPSRYTYLSKIVKKNIAWKKARYTFQFLLPFILQQSK